MKLVCNYMQDFSLRQQLNRLTQKTFGFDFQDWESGGYDVGDYIPWSYVQDGRMISNVSANRMCFLQNGELRNYIQIGTVMTDTAYRHQGLARDLMEKVLAAYAPQCDGFYLFGDLSALGFYEKMGFTQCLQYQYRLKESVLQTQCGFSPVTREGLGRYLDAVRTAAPNSAFDLRNKFGLQLFYTASLQDVFHCEELDCYIVLAQGETPVLKSVICPRIIPLQEILIRLPCPCDGLVLGFTPRPEDATPFTPEPFDGGEDYRLFYKGDALAAVSRERLFFPLLSHA